MHELSTTSDFEEALLRNSTVNTKIYDRILLTSSEDTFITSTVIRTVIQNAD